MGADPHLTTGLDVSERWAPLQAGLGHSPGRTNFRNGFQVGKKLSGRRVAVSLRRHRLEAPSSRGSCGMRAPGSTARYLLGPQPLRGQNVHQAGQWCARRTWGQHPGWENVRRLREEALLERGGKARGAQRGCAREPGRWGVGALASALLGRAARAVWLTGNAPDQVPDQ